MRKLPTRPMLWLSVLPVFAGGGAHAVVRPARSAALDVKNQSAFPNYDVRLALLPADAATAASVSHRLSEAQRTGVARTLTTMRTAQALLAFHLPSARLEPSRFLGTPEIVDSGSATRFLTAPSTGSRAAIARNYLSANAAVYGLTADDAAGLKVVADYANPAGNMAWVEFQQEISGIPVFQGTLRAALTKTGAVARTTGLLVPGLLASGVPALPALTPAEATATAARSIGVAMNVKGLSARTLAANASVVSGTPFTEDVKTSLTWFPLEPGAATLAYSMVLWQDVNAYYVLVDAATGELLWRKNITNEQTAGASYSVYLDDSPTPLSPTTAVPGSGTVPAAINRTLVTEISELPAYDNLGWIPDGGNTTTGNNVDAGLDVVSPNGIDATGRATGNPARVFNFPYTPGGQAGAIAPTDANYRMGAVTNIFFWANRYHDRLYELGFTEAARNFQNNNFGRGGAGSDYVRAEAQDYGGTNNANFATPPDGQLPRMQMYVFKAASGYTGPVPPRDGDLDGDVFLHELTHGVSNRLHANASGLGSTISGGMGEGWSDFYARCLLSTADEDVNGVYASGGYVTNTFYGEVDNYYYGIRRFPYAVISSVGPNGKPYNPLTFADIDSSQLSGSDGAYPFNPTFGLDPALEVHNIGEIWCSTLLEVRARLITRLGFAEGNRRTMQLVTDAMKLDPANPTFIQARDSILAADAAGYGGADEDDIWAGFAARGMGTTADESAVSFPKVVEGFDTNLPLTLVSLDDPDGNGTGIATSTETVRLTLSVKNPYLARTITGITATIDGKTVAFPDLGPGASSQQAVNYVVPNTPCGSVVTPSVTVNSSLGPVTRTIAVPLDVTGVGFTENFDGVTPPALPFGWASSVTPATTTQKPWTTSTVRANSAPNSAAWTPVNISSVNNSGDSNLDSAPVSIPSEHAVLAFKLAYNLEGYYDGMRLEMNVDGGAFNDVLSYGCVFLSGGYDEVAVAGYGDSLGYQAVWTGLSGGTSTAPAYKTVSVALPPSIQGHSVQFRWRAAVDSDTNATGLPGAWIDDVTVTNALSCTVTFPTQYTTTDVANALMIAAGLRTVTYYEKPRLNIVAGATPGVVDMQDAVALARKVAGIDP